VKLLLALVCAVLLVGCERAAVVKSDGWLMVQDGMGAAGVKEVVLPSGLRCVVMVGYQKGGLTCDFSNAVPK
jgi:hypothetical protein